MKPGIHKISNELYHKGEGISSSDIKEILKSPAHYLAKKAAPTEATPEMIKGTLVHALILEPETFENEFHIGDGFKYRTGKEYQKLVDANPGKYIILKEEFEEANRIALAVAEQAKQNENLFNLLQGKKEVSFYSEHKSGVLCKARPDILNPNGSIVDLKTARDASFDSFQKALVDLQYFISAAYYLKVVGDVFKANKFPDEAPTKFKFIVVETKAPYPVAIYGLEQSAIQFGDFLIEKAIEKYAEAVATDTWSGYPKEEIAIGLPNYTFYKFSYAGYQGSKK